MFPSIKEIYGTASPFNEGVYLSNFSHILSDQSSSQVDNPDKSKNKLNVISFGATPNDEIDDSRAFKNALRIASNYSSILYIPEGQYILNEEIKLPNNIAVEGQSSKGTILTRINISSTNNTNSIDPIISAVGKSENMKSNITISNLTIKGQGPRTTGNCIELSWVKNYIIHNVFIYDCGKKANEAGIYTRGTINGIIANNTIENSLNGFYSSQPSNTTNNIKLLNNTISNSIKDAIQYRNGTYSNISDNKIFNASENGIHLMSVHNTDLVNNHIFLNNTFRPLTGINVSHNSDNILLTNNNIVEGLTGIHIRGDGSDERRNSNITLQFNNVSNTLLSCIYADFANDIRIANNTFEYCNNRETGETFGIKLGSSGTEILVANNTVLYNGRITAVGISLDGADNLNITSNTLKSNPILGNHGIGIKIAPFSSDVNVERNDFHECGCVILNESFEPTVLIRNNTT